MRLLLLLSSFAITFSSFAQDSTAWLGKNATLIFHEAFEREEDGNLAKAIGNGWNSATADRGPNVKMADLDGGILKVASASEAAKHAAHIHHEAGFTDGGAVVRFRFPGLSKGESLQLGFVDRETKGVHAGHLCYGILSQSSVTLVDQKTGIMNLENRRRRDEAVAKKEKIPADLEALLKNKSVNVPFKADTKWHELILLTVGDEMRLTLDGKLLAKHRSEGYAHPMKRWFSFLIPNTVWIDDVKIWKIKRTVVARPPWLRTVASRSDRSQFPTQFPPSLLAHAFSLLLAGVARLSSVRADHRRCGSTQHPFALARSNAGQCHGLRWQ